MITRHRDRQNGQMLVVFAIALIALIAMVGLVLDGGGAYAQRRDQQNVADLSALAAADALVNGKTQAEAITIAKDVAASNHFTDGTNGVSVTVTFPTNRVQVDVQGSHRNYFGGIVGQSMWQVSTTAQAQALSGTPDTAVGAAPVIMPASDFSGGLPLPAYTAATCAPAGCDWGNGNGDVPNNPTDWAWTLYGPGVNSSTVKSYLDGVGALHGVAGCNGTPPPGVTIAANTSPYWGQGNNGMHNGAFNSANCIIGLDVPVPLVGPPTAPATTCTGSTQTDGCFKGWAMFHVTAWNKHGNTSTWSGWFLDATIQYPNLTVTSCSGTACPSIGPVIFKLNLVN